MECFSIDESGYTGFDLLNAEQRFQGAAAIAITHEEASRLSGTFPTLHWMAANGRTGRKTEAHIELISGSSTSAS